MIGRPCKQCFCFGAAMSVDSAHDEINSFAQAILGGSKHGKSFADSGRHAEKDAQLPAVSM